MLLWCFPRSIAAEGGEEETGFDTCDAAEIAHFADVTLGAVLPVSQRAMVHCGTCNSLANWVWVRPRDRRNSLIC